jgi:uncharacterized protein (TIGR02996 family)
MSLEAVFWQAVRDAPDDDTPRLVYADWLTDRGDRSSLARAEHIRLQCALARLHPDARRHELVREVQALEQEYAEDWLRPLREHYPLGGDQKAIPFFIRGFVERLHLEPLREDYLARIEPFLRQHPVRTLTIQCRRPLDPNQTLTAVAECPALDRLTTLGSTARGQLHRRTIQALSDASHLSGLHTFDIWCDLDVGTLRFLMASSLLDHVTHLRTSALPDQGIPALREIVQSPRAGRLLSLDLGSWTIGDSGVRLLVQSPGLTSLRVLGLGHNHLSERGVRLLARSPFLGQLDGLDLEINSLPAEAGRHLGESPYGTRLESLDLSHNDLGDAGMRELLTSREFPRLRHLDLGYNQIGPEGLNTLLATPRLPALRTLELGGNPIGNPGAQALADSPHAQNLREITLHDCQISPAGYRALAASPFLSGVTCLCLHGREVPSPERRALRERFGANVVLLDAGDES